MTVEPHVDSGVAAEGAVAAIGGHVVDDPEIEIAVAIEIGERAAGAPAWLTHTRDRRHVRERAIAAIAVQHVGPVVRDVKVGTSIAVVVAGAGAHAVLAVADPRALRDVFEARLPGARLPRLW